MEEELESKMFLQKNYKEIKDRDEAAEKLCKRFKK